MSRRRLEEERLLQEEHTNRSPLDKGYWDGFGQHIRFNAKEEETGRSEVITFARDGEQPHAIETSEDNTAFENGSDSIAV